MSATTTTSKTTHDWQVKTTTTTETTIYRCVDGANSAFCGRSGYGPGTPGETLSWEKLDQCFVRSEVHFVVTLLYKT